MVKDEFNDYDDSLIHLKFLLTGITANFFVKKNTIVFKLIILIIIFFNMQFCLTLEYNKRAQSDKHGQHTFQPIFLAFLGRFHKKYYLL